MDNVVPHTRTATAAAIFLALAEFMDLLQK
jgi:hypothetical protein